MYGCSLLQLTGRYYRDAIAPRSPPLVALCSAAAGKHADTYMCIDIFISICIFYTVCINLTAIPGSLGKLEPQPKLPGFEGLAAARLMCDGPSLELFHIPCHKAKFCRGWDHHNCVLGMGQSHLGVAQKEGHKIEPW